MTKIKAPGLLLIAVSFILGIVTTLLFQTGCSPKTVKLPPETVQRLDSLTLAASRTDSLLSSLSAKEKEIRMEQAQMDSLINGEIIYVKNWVKHQERTIDTLKYFLIPVRRKSKEFDL